MSLVNKEAIVKILRSTLSAQTKKKKLKNYHDGDIADALALLTKEERFKAYELFGVERTAEIFSYFDNPEDYIEELKADKAADILDELDSDEAINILDELDEDFRNHLISLMEKETREKVEALDKRDDETIGSYMSDNYITISKDATIKQAMSQLIKEAGEHDNINTLYVIDEESHLLGAVRLKDLIVARKDDSLDKIIISSFPSVLESELVSEIIQTLKDYAEESIPIVDKDNKLLGVISLDNIIEAADEEMTEDYAKLGGLSEIVDVDESPFYSVKKRIPWLIVLLFLGIVVSTVTGTFEAVIAAIPVAVFFQSMVLDMAGNVGTQSLAVTIRTISDEDMKKQEIRRLIGKEILVGFINGIIVAVVAFVFVLVYLSIKQQAITTDHFVITDVLKISGIIATSLLLAMTASSAIGSFFPILLSKLHIDPAVASGPFITTFNDIIAVLLYYGLTYLFLMVLHI